MLGAVPSARKRHSAGSVPGMTALVVGSATAGVYMHVRAGVAGVSGINDLDAPITTIDDARPPGPHRPVTTINRPPRQLPLHPLLAVS